MSADFLKHPVGYFTQGLLTAQRPEDITYVCYSNRKDGDDLTPLLRRAADDWIDVWALDDDALVNQVHNDMIDVLIDLSGHSSGNRLLTFASKPAPVQATWAGYMGTTGVAAIDYLIADPYYVGAGEEAFYTEEILHLPKCYVTYTPPDYMPDLTPPAFERNGFITFASFNNPRKLNDAVFRAWAEILTRVPESRLYMKYKYMDAPSRVAGYLKAFEELGIDPDRITVEGNSESHADFLECYADVDIALDSFPYSGGLTTCEALWLGVPVVTKPEETFASRHSRSYLLNLGLESLIAADAASYVDIASGLARDREALTQLRRTLRGRVQASAICDYAGFASDFAAAMRKIWRVWCQDPVAGR